MNDTLPAALIIAGPTASGKSALALAVAARRPATIINADSMQLYAELRVLTARPTPEEEALAPHRLYGVRGAAEAASVAWWREQALAEMQAARDAGRLPILCGGTGFFFNAMIAGLSAIPPVPDAVREEARALLTERGPAALHALLAEADPASAARLRPSDSQRIARAYEVWRSTGRGLASWQGGAGTGPAPWHFFAMRIDPPRDELRAAIAARWHSMLAEGALEEVRALVRAGLDPALPAMRALGVPELAAHLAGRLTLREASAQAMLKTGQYIKRQATWFRHHDLAPPAHTHIFHARFTDFAQFSESKLTKILAFIDLTG